MKTQKKKAAAKKPVKVVKKTAKKVSKAKALPPQADMMAQIISALTSQNPNVRVVRLPEGVTPNDPEAFQKAAEKAIQESYHKDVKACAKEIFKVCQRWPVLVSVEALEAVFQMAVAHFGDEELDSLQRHLKNFHAELSLMLTPETTQRVQ